MSERSRPEDLSGDSPVAGMRTPIVAGLLLLLMTAIVIQQPWFGDSWEHAAVNRALAHNPLSPSHPILDLDAPHAFFSPYALLWGVVGRVFGMGPVDVLGLAAVVNLVLLFAGLRFLVGAYCPGSADAATAYALVFMVLLWGPDPWIFSGCFQLGGLANAASYPSCFATALTLIALASARHRLGAATWPWLLGVGFLTWVVLLTHPVTFGFLAVGLGATALATRRRRAHFEVVGVILFAVAFAAAWPYYPFWQLVAGHGNSFASFNMAMFRQVIPRILPAVVVGLPFAVVRLRRDGLDPLTVTVTGLAAIYVAALLLQHGLLGRSIFHVVILLQIIGAIGIAEVENTLAGRLIRRRAAIASVVVVLASLAAFESTIGVAFRQAFSGAQTRFARFDFLHDHLGPGDVVLTSRRRGWYVPMTGAKIVVPRSPLAFVPDLVERNHDVKKFFRPKTTTRRRLAIIRRWGVTHVMLETDYATGHQQVTRSLGDRLELVEKKGQVVLLRVVEPGAVD